MKFQLKALAVAALVSVSGIASAAVDTGLTGDGELFLMAFDTTSQQTYSFDTGVLMSTFLPNTSVSQSFILTGFDSFLSGGVVASTVRWGVYAADRLAPTSLYTTGPLTGASSTNPTLSKMNNANSAIASFLNDANTRGTNATQANGYSIQTAAPLSGTDFSYGGTIVGANGNFNSNLSFNTTGALGDSLSFFRINNGTAGSSTRTVFNDSVGPSTWSIDSATNSLVFTAAPVPEPGTYALMLAGLLTLGAVARRRTK